MIKVKGVSTAQKALAKSRKELDKILNRRIALAAQYVHVSVTHLTAVWMGTTLANWQWSIGTPATGERDAAGRGAPGQTSQMALGQEPRRAANQAVADKSFKSIKFDPKDPYKKYILTNNHGVSSLMEAGLAPDAARARTSDMIKITKEGVLDYIRSMGLT